jgi:hypothetical protein
MKNSLSKKILNSPNKNKRKKRRSFLISLFYPLLILPIFKYGFFISNNKEGKLKKNKNLIWYLNDDD